MNKERDNSKVVAVEKTADETLLSIKDLTIQYVTREMGTCKAVTNFTLDIKKGETIGLVGETGAGKTTVALGILKLIYTPPGKYVNGTVNFDGVDLMQLSNEEMRKIRGKRISMIFQDPMTALNPIDKVIDQVAEVILLHEDVNMREAVKKANEILEMVGIPIERHSDYPHQFSGGMKQRVVIAIALACNPELLIADEPTTALDVTIQAQVLDMMNELKARFGTSVLLITHDLGVVAHMCQRVAVMYAGEIVEVGEAEHIFNETSHPYTIGLFESLPNMVSGDERLKPIKGLMPDPSNLPKGCNFSDRCPYATEQCKETDPELTEVSPGHFVKCRYTEKVRGEHNG